MIDDLDRQIVAALIRNGRAPFRLIAEVLGQQERTVARRANKLLAAGHVRVQAFPNPGALAPVDLYMLRVDIDPLAMDAVATWLANREETHWVSALAGSSQCIVEMFLSPPQIGEFLYQQLAEVPGVRNFHLDPVFRYYRTVSGWCPDILSARQYELLGPAETPALITRSEPHPEPKPEGSRASLLELLRVNGRATLEEVSHELGISKTTASRRLDALIADGVVYVRAILDPGTIGYPLESLVAVSLQAKAMDSVGQWLAGQPGVRWAANAAGKLLVQTANRTAGELHAVLSELESLDGVREASAALVAGIYKRSTVAYQQGKLPPV